MSIEWHLEESLQVGHLTPSSRRDWFVSKFHFQSSAAVLRGQIILSGMLNSIQKASIIFHADEHAWAMGQVHFCHHSITFWICAFWNSISGAVQLFAGIYLQKSETVFSWTNASNKPDTIIPDQIWLNQKQLDTDCILLLVLWSLSAPLHWSGQGKRSQRRPWELSLSQDCSTCPCSMPVWKR